MSRSLAYQRYLEIISKIEAACRRSARDASQVKLVAVCKTQPNHVVQEFLQDANQAGFTPIIAENYVQEFKRRQSELTGSYKVHLIGPLQSNKVRDAVKLFDLIESAHSTEILSLIDKEAARIGKVQAVYLQVNISQDQAKSGFDLETLSKFLKDEAPALKHLRLEGLMAITKLYAEAEQARPDFRALRELRDQLLPGAALSMGMSSDFEIAVEEGATSVRVGSAIFGERA